MIEEREREKEKEKKKKTVITDEEIAALFRHYAGVDDPVYKNSILSQFFWRDLEILEQKK